MAKLTNKEFLKVAEKIKNGEATPKEKLKLLKNINASIEEISKMSEDLIEAMEKETKK